MGYDGKGQVRVKNIDELRAAFTQLKGVVLRTRKMLPLAYEVSVLVARADGQKLSSIRLPKTCIATASCSQRRHFPSPHVSAEAALKTRMQR